MLLVARQRVDALRVLEVVLVQVRQLQKVSKGSKSKGCGWPCYRDGQHFRQTMHTDEKQARQGQPQAVEAAESI